MIWATQWCSIVVQKNDRFHIHHFRTNRKLVFKLGADFDCEYLF